MIHIDVNLETQVEKNGLFLVDCRSLSSNELIVFCLHYQDENFDFESRSAPLLSHTCTLMVIMTRLMLAWPFLVLCSCLKEPSRPNNPKD